MNDVVLANFTDPHVLDDPTSDYTATIEWGDGSTDAGTVDAASTPYGRFLYVQAGGPGAVDEFAVGHGGFLAEIGSVTVAGAAGGEGIAAS